jgi:hypothetical protein
MKDSSNSSFISTFLCCKYCCMNCLIFCQATFCLSPFKSDRYFKCPYRLSVIEKCVIWINKICFHTYLEYFILIEEKNMLCTFTRTCVEPILDEVQLVGKPLITSPHRPWPTLKPALHHISEQTTRDDSIFIIYMLLDIILRKNLAYCCLNWPDIRQSFSPLLHMPLPSNDNQLTAGWHYGILHACQTAICEYMFHWMSKKNIQKDGTEAIILMPSWF